MHLFALCLHGHGNVDWPRRGWGGGSQRVWQVQLGSDHSSSCSSSQILLTPKFAVVGLASYAGNAFTQMAIEEETLECIPR